VSAASTLAPVLLIGGSGRVGIHAARTLRRLHPGLPITVGGRDLDRAEAVAREIGNAAGAKLDLARPGLGLPGDARFSAVVVLLKDDTLHSMTFAQDRGVPYVSFADFAFDIGPEIARFATRPASAPVLLLGHTLGGTVTPSVLHFARELRSVDRIAIALLLDEADVGGPAAQVDFERVAMVPRPLLREDGRWVWASGEQATRTVTGIDGRSWTAHAYSLLDVPSLAATTGAASVRLDLAVKPTRSTGARSPLEVIVELDGRREDGTRARLRWEVVDHDHSEVSGRGVALAVERLLGLTGGPPAAPGLLAPETLHDPAFVVERLRELGSTIRADSVP
jgi:hypothetical protein